MSRRLMLPGIYYTAEARALFARMTTAPNSARKKLINRTIKQLKAAGLWAKMDALYFLAAADEQAALLNWKGATYNLTKTGSPAFNADRGFTGQDTGGSPVASGYLSTGFTPSTAGGHFVLNSASLAVWSRTSAATSGTAIGGVFDYSLIGPRVNSSQGICGLNQSGSDTFSSSDGSGLFNVSRVASGGTEIYRNGASVATITHASTGLLTEQVRILAGSQGSSVTEPWLGQAAFAAIGAGLDDTEAAALYAIVQPYMTAVGAA